MNQKNQPKDQMYSSYLARVLLARDRDPERLLKQQGVRAEHAARLADRALRTDSETIVYSIVPGRARLLLRSEESRAIRWSAELVDIDHVYSSSGEASAAAERVYKRLKRRSTSVYGWGAWHVSLLDAIKEGARHLCAGKIYALTDRAIQAAEASSDEPTVAVQRWFVADDGELTNLH